jgi:hypothetical protein
MGLHSIIIPEHSTLQGVITFKVHWKTDEWSFIKFDTGFTMIRQRIPPVVQIEHQ